MLRKNAKMLQTNMTNNIERDLESWAKDQQICDIADGFLRVLVEKQMDVQTSLRIVDKMNRAIKQSTQSACWGTPLTLTSAPNDAATWLPSSEVAAEFKRRQDTV